MVVLDVSGYLWLWVFMRKKIQHIISQVSESNKSTLSEFLQFIVTQLKLINKIMKLLINKTVLYMSLLSIHKQQSNDIKVEPTGLGILLYFPVLVEATCCETKKI